MKTIFTLVIFFSSLIASAFDQNSFHPGRASQLQLRVMGYGDYTLMIGNRNFRMNQGLVRLNYLPSGVHPVRIVQEVYNPRGRYMGVQPVFRGQLRIPAGSRVFARVLPNGRLVIDRVMPLGRVQSRPPGRNPNFSWDHDDWDGWNDWGTRDGWDNNWDQRQDRSRHNGYYYFNQQDEFDSREDYFQSGGNFQNPQFNNNQNRFQLFMTSLSDESFDDTRFELASVYAQQNNLSSAQVLQIMQQFSFESTRLKFAKNAYQSVYDPENYFLVNQGFSFSQSKQELSRHVQQFGRI